MLDLSGKIGLNVKLDDQNKLEFGEGVDLEKMSARSFADLKIVAADENLNLSDDPAYLMYRNVRRKGDEALLEKHAQRFDLTVIPASMLGDEYIKTSGHYHPVKPGTGVEYPELYYVVSGQATYLMQKHEKDGTISDVILARVPAGEAIIMPPFYGHVTINELDETLVMANWVEASFSSVYGDYEEKRGASHYVTKSDLRQAQIALSDSRTGETRNPNDETNAKIIKNPNYSNTPELKIMKSRPLALESLKDTPIYDYSREIGKIELIAKPEQYLDDFTMEKLFRM